MKKQVLICDYCGKTIYRYPSQIKRHNFCSRECLSAFSSKTLNPTGYQSLKDLRSVSEHMSALNRRLNPSRMTPEVRAKLRLKRLNTGAGVTYAKLYGKHEHRVIVEQELGRPLRKGEVVHHINGDRRDNRPENLQVLGSQAEHARLHKQKAR